MEEKTFDWMKTEQLSFLSLLMAVFGPSAFAFWGFHRVLPYLVDAGMPPLLAWPTVAGTMLFIFSFIAIYLLVVDAGKLGIPIRARLCLQPVSIKKWILYVTIALIMMGLVSLIQIKLPAIWDSLGVKIPDYMPFFLKGIDPTTTPVEQFSPGFEIRGAYWLIPFMAIVLFLNIVVEDLYFRAWLLPKMARYGNFAWVMNGILFALYHTFQIWLLPILLLASLSFAFVVWDSKSIIPSLVLHFFLNFVFAILGMLSIVMQTIP